MPSPLAILPGLIWPFTAPGTCDGTASGPFTRPACCYALDGESWAVLQVGDCHDSNAG
jgi:hypothetical protein